MSQTAEIERLTKTPWPIERGIHPSGSPRNYDVIKIPGLLDGAQAQTLDYDPEEFTTRCFRQARITREYLLKYVSIEPLNNFDGGSVFYLWLGKKCPVGCKFCFFQSPTRVERDGETEITDEGISNLITYSQVANLEQFTISGGGEPMMYKRKVFRLARGVKADRFTVVTSGYWAMTRNKTNDILTEWRANVEANPHQPKAVVRISLDKDHFQQLGRKRGFQYIDHILDWFAENAPESPNFTLLFHTMEGDLTIENLLSRLDIESRQEINKPFNHKTIIKLKNGFSFRIEYSQLFDSDPRVNLGNREQLANRFQTYSDYLEFRAAGSQSLKRHKDGPDGLDYLVLYDGTFMIWGATTPDIETTIYSHDYQSAMTTNLRDIITLATLEKGPNYIQRLISEVNPKAVERAIGIHLRDFYSRLLLEEDTTRLYLSIRLIQEYLAEGRINDIQMRQWPAAIRILVNLDKQILQEIYRRAGYNIVSQYLDDPEVSAEKLLTLYELIQLQQYDVTPDQMVEQVLLATNIDDSIKKIFISEIYLGNSSQSTT